MSLTLDEVKHVAKLARLQLSEAELETMRVELSHILGHIDMLREVDVSNVPPTAQVTDLLNIMRADALRVSLAREDALANAPEQQEGMFRVGPIFGE
jgi:aspartyl-tRNA(Asn)/glutamyl-tRNA(Gln) amidotransferase subunit C